MEHSGQADLADDLMCRAGIAIDRKDRSESWRWGDVWRWSPPMQEWHQTGTVATLSPGQSLHHAERACGAIIAILDA